MKPGSLASVRRALEHHGDIVKAGHESLGALSAEVHASDVSDLARQPWVESVSLDADVFAIGSGDKDRKPRVERTNQQSGTDKHTNPAPDTHLRESPGLSATAANGTPTGEGIVWALLDISVGSGPQRPPRTGREILRGTGGNIRRGTDANILWGTARSAGPFFLRYRMACCTVPPRFPRTFHSGMLVRFWCT